MDIQLKPYTAHKVEWRSRSGLIGGYFDLYTGEYPDSAIKAFEADQGVPIKIVKATPKRGKSPGIGKPQSRRDK